MIKMNGGLKTHATMAIANLIEKLPIGRFTSQDNCKKELLTFLGGDHLPNEGLLRYAVESRKREIQWIWLYIPSIMFGLMMFYILCFGTILPVSRYIFFALFMLVSLAILFKITFYKSYEDCYKNIILAASDLLRNPPIRTSIKKVKLTSKKVERVAPKGLTNIQAEMPALQEMSIQQEAPPQTEQKPALSQTDSAEVGAAKPEDAIKKTVYGEELLPLFKEAGEGLKYGRITIFLLDQLIRHECKQPSVYDDPIMNISESTEILGCKAKNIGSKFQGYYSRESIRFEKKNGKTTHRKYLKILQLYYQKRKDPVLYDQAKNLESFVSSIKIEGKTRKMHLPS